MRPILRLLLTAILVSFAHSGFAAPPAHFWSFSAGAPGLATPYCMAVLPLTGEFAVAGVVSGTVVNLGGSDYVLAGGNPAAFLARYTSGGKLEWAQFFEGSGTEQGDGVTFDASGNIYLAGEFTGSINLGGQAILPSNGNTDIFLAKYAPSGTHLWSKNVGGTGDEAPARALAVDAAGNVFVTGFYNAATNLGGGLLPYVADFDLFIAKYNTNGLWQWNIVTGSAGNDRGQGIALDGSGNVYVCGIFENSVSFSGQPLTSAGALDAFLVKYSNDGIIQWSQKRGSTGDDYALNVAADAAGNVALTGGFHGSVNFGGSTLNSAGNFDGFLARYNTSGVHQWSLRFGGTGEEIGERVAIDPNGKVFVAGEFSSSSVDMGGGSMPSPGTEFDTVIAKYSSSGTHTWSRAAGGTNSDLVTGLGADVNGNAIVSGVFYSSLDLGGGIVSGKSGSAFFAKYGVGEPFISSIADIGNDQGRNVRLSVTRSLLDNGTAAHPITEYQAFRRVLPLPASAMRGAQPVPSGTWEFVASVPASGAKNYRIIAPTLADSTITLGMYRTKFFVRAATDDPVVFFDSPVDSGYSKDNLAPSIPQNFMFTTGNLTWKESQDADFDYFSVYGSNSNAFGSATLINYTTTTGIDVTAQPFSYYYVTATDFSGNEGKPAIVHALTGVGSTPGKYVLSVSAYPNPFNPLTTVRYTLPAKGHVTLDVYDLRGERVATLVNEDRDAGAYTATWHGTNDRGATVSSGVYFAKLSAPKGERSYKLVLLK